ncbi:TIM barrel protein [soil metagenome]
MQIGFSSLGAPELNLADLSSLAEEFSMDFLELRTVDGTMGLPEYFADHPELSAKRSSPIQVISSSLQLIEATDAQIAEFSRYAEVAVRFNAPYVRVFSGGDWGRPVSDKDIALAVANVQRCQRELGNSGLCCELLLETHFAFSSSEICRRLVDSLDEPLAILWDSHHTWARNGETPQQSWDLIGQWVRHIHYKDSVAGATGMERTYVVPGSGEFPTTELLGVLAWEEYSEGFSLEWEKLWHPEMPDLRSALPAFRDLAKGH